MTIPASDRYTHGHHASVVGQHARRTAQQDAAYLMSHLRPGMRVLDVGCGPGTITAGLARAVTPGMVVGVDVVDAVLHQARQHAASEGLDAVSFAGASVYALPYADRSWDIVHMHQVLQHLQRPVDALREARRVLVPEGILAVRDADYGTMTAWPALPEVARWLDLYHAVAARNGADPDAGRRLPAWVAAAGFSDIEVSATTVAFHDRAEIENWGGSLAERVTKSSFGEQAIEYGLATREDLEVIAEGWRRWTGEPDAFFFYVNIECLARVT